MGGLFSRRNANRGNDYIVEETPDIEPARTSVVRPKSKVDKDGPPPKPRVQQPEELCGDYVHKANDGIWCISALVMMTQFRLANPEPCPVLKYDGLSPAGVKIFNFYPSLFALIPTRNHDRLMVRLVRLALKHITYHAGYDDFVIVVNNRDAASRCNLPEVHWIKKFFWHIHQIHGQQLQKIVIKDAATGVAFMLGKLKEKNKPFACPEIYEKMKWPADDREFNIIVANATGFPRDSQSPKPAD